MEDRNIVRYIEDGNIFSLVHGARSLSVWHSNPEWSGVLLADLASGADTKEVFSSHLVRVGRGHEVPDHLHESQWEWNIILAGHGTMLLDGKEIPFGPGDSFTTPPGVHHAVVAEREDIALLAVFSPCPG
ncbi:MAG: cupin domain-containing protein [Methanomicrobiales archaeon]|nr:cupin domain-containing protein [Methanomicrobiales archaeon]